MLTRPHWSRVVGVAVATAVISFFIGWTDPDTPILVMGTGLGVLVSALAISPDRFSKPGEYAVSLAVPGFGIGWLLRIFRDDIQDAIGTYGYEISDDAVVAAVPLAAAAVTLLIYAFFIGVRTNTNADA